MNRRQLLAGLGLVPLAPLAAKAAPITTPTHHPDGESYHDKYWNAQGHINELEEVRITHDAVYHDTDMTIQTQPDATLRVYTGDGKYAELRHDGENFVIENMVNGRKLVV